MNAWWGTYVFIMCLWSFVYSNHEIKNGRLVVQCNDKYIYSKEDAVFYSGEPSKIGQCNRYLWNTTEELKGKNSFPMPRTLKAGWAGYMTGAVTKNTRVSINLGNDSSLRLTFDIRMNYLHFHDAVVLNEGLAKKAGSYWEHTQQICKPRPFPISAGKEFTIMFVAERDKVVTFYINGKKLVSRRLVYSIHDFTFMEIEHYYKARVVNLWAQPVN